MASAHATGLTRATGQSMVSFLRKSFRAVPHAHVRVIEMVQIGSNEQYTQADGPNLNELRLYAETFFGIPVRIAAKSIPVTAELLVGARCGDGDGGGGGGGDCDDVNAVSQLSVQTCFDVMKRRKLERDVLCTVGVTMYDLYSGEEDSSFVYGTASAFDGMGVFSFARYTSSNVDNGTTAVAPGKPESDVAAAGSSAGADAGTAATTATPRAGARETGAAQADYRLTILYRSCKVLSHEVGHLFGIEHCIYYECLMCGCNHLEEFDKRYEKSKTKTTPKQKQKHTVLQCDHS